MDDLLKDFLTETNESMEVLDLEIVKLEQNPNDPELLSNVFRLVHTIKGTCGFLGLPRLEAVAHASENVLGKVRDGVLEVTPEAVTLILASLDRIKVLLAALEQNQTEPEGDDKDLISRLDAMAERSAAAGKSGQAAAAKSGQAAAPQQAPSREGATGKASLYEQIGGFGPIDAAVETFTRRALSDERLGSFIKGLDLDRFRAQFTAFLAKLAGGPAEYDGVPLAQVHAYLAPRGFSEAHFGHAVAMLERALGEMDAPAEAARALMGLLTAVREEWPLPAASEQAEQEESHEAAHAPEDKKPVGEAGDGPGARQSAVAAQNIRVNLALLENLMNLVSEMVLTRNQLLQILRAHKESDFTGPLQRLNQITTELQEEVMKTRMQPIGNAWSKLPRIVRDLARELGKKIDLQMNGAETELDRQVLELIKDPLTHMVRNSADHGLEMPEDRRQAGKPDTGKIVLNARHEGGHIIIEIIDDGRGLDLERIKAKVLSNALATKAEIDAMTDQQVMQFVFRAGFSTAQKVTSVSGRGVGMDVARSNIDKIGGSIEVQSMSGRGTTFVIKIPLTLAIVSTLIVGCGTERFAIPQIGVVELVRASKSSQNRVEYVNGTPVLRLRDRLLPLVSLRALLRLENGERKLSDEEAFIIVTQVGTATFGIIVDRVFDTEEIVVKPVAPILREISMFSGNTILGDGSVVMILDTNGIAAAMGEGSRADVAAAQGQAAIEAGHGERVSLLVFRAGEGTQKAVPLSVVARLEEIDVKTIEFTDGKPIVQYRGKLMPLVPIAGEHAVKESGRQPVVVFADEERSIGLLVDEIVDIVDQELVTELSTGRPGFIGTAVIAGVSTEIIDAGHYAGLALKDWFARATVGRVRQQPQVLLIDDSPFFRNLICPLLAQGGYEVTPVASAEEALALCAAGRDFDLIVSDIEMPGMTGIEFAEAVRANERWRDTPLVALSAHADQRDLDRGRQAGFDDFVAKYQRDALLEALSETLANARRAA